MPLPAGYHSVEGKAPDGVESVEFGVSVRQLKELQRRGPTWKFLDSALLEESLSNPTVIFQGLQREEFESALCYCGRPSRRFTKNFGIEVPFPKSFILAISVIHDHRGYIVLDWELRKEDPVRPGYPLGYQHDFEKQIWPDLVTY